jgi:hypothetical protein
MTASTAQEIKADASNFLAAKKRGKFTKNPSVPFPERMRRTAPEFHRQSAPDQRV